VHLTFKHPWRDGTTGAVFDPVTFLGRLAVLVPRPRVNLLLYYGVLGGRSAWRGPIARSRIPADGAEPESRGADDGPPEGSDPGRNPSWARLMARAFGFDVLSCPRCGGRLRLVALISQAGVVGNTICGATRRRSVTLSTARYAPLTNHNGRSRLRRDLIQ
jgi:hypothetical protein